MSAGTFATLSAATDRPAVGHNGAMTQPDTDRPTALTDAEISELIATMPEGMGALNEKMGISLVEVGVDRVVGTMPVRGNTQPYGLLHGGASVVLAETLGSVGAALHAGPDRIAVGLDINATHHRAARTGRVTGTATPISAGSTIVSYHVAITDEDGKPVCTSRITCLLRDAPPAR